MTFTSTRDADSGTPESKIGLCKAAANVNRPLLGNFWISVATGSRHSRKLALMPNGLPIAPHYFQLEADVTTFMGLHFIQMEPPQTCDDVTIKVALL